MKFNQLTRPSQGRLRMLCEKSIVAALLLACPFDLWLLWLFSRFCESRQLFLAVPAAAAAASVCGWTRERLSLCVFNWLDVLLMCCCGW